MLARSAQFGPNIEHASYGEPVYCGARTMYEVAVMQDKADVD